MSDVNPHLSERRPNALVVDGDGYNTPVEFEDQHYRQMNPQQQPLPGELTIH